MKDDDVTTVEPRRQNSFDFVRLLAALSVLVAHQLSMAGVYFAEYGPPTLGPWGPKLADAGLYVFFAISGYLNFFSLSSDRRLHRFVLARLLRIYPGATVNAVLCILLGALLTSASQLDYWRSGLTWSYGLHNTLLLYTPTQFLLPGYLAQAPFPAVNTPIWTLKYELAAYLTLLVLYAGCKRFSLPTMLIVATAFAAMTVCFYYTRAYPRDDGVGLDSLGSFYFVHTARFMTVFFFGTLYAVIESNGIRKFPLALLLLGLQIVAALTSDPLARIVFILLLATLSIEIGKTALLCTDLYRRIGDLSYGTYLYAFPIQMITVTYFLTAENFWWLTFIDITIVLMVAKASWTYVERPALRLKARI